MHHHPRRTALAAAGILLTATAGAAVPASAATDSAAAGRAPATALVVNARWAGHCSFDRLVIDVRGHMPPVTVKPVRQLRYDGSGKKVPLPGRYFLEIKFSPAAAHTMSGKPVYRGPRLVKIHLPKLKGLALTGDFEGVVTFGTAFRTKPHYKAYTVRAPARFVLDVKHVNICS